MSSNIWMRPDPLKPHFDGVHDLRSFPWYFPDISAADANKILANKPAGSYLVRRSTRYAEGLKRARRSMFEAVQAAPSVYRFPVVNPESNASQGFLAYMDIKTKDIYSSQVPMSTGSQYGKFNLQSATELGLDYFQLMTSPATLLKLEHLRQLKERGLSLSMGEAERRLQEFVSKGSTKVNLMGLQLDVLPDTLCSLENLRDLTIADNQLCSLPEEIGQLTRLEELNVCDNKLTELPRAIGALVNLRALSVSGNQLTELPQSLSVLTNLKKLDVGYNEMRVLSSSIGALSNLQTLWVSNNRLAALPQSISALRDLESLYVSNNQLTELPQSIGALTKLEKLIASENQLVELPHSLGTLTNLREVQLNNNKLKSLPTSMSNLSNLRILWLYENMFQILPECLLQMPTNVELMLFGNPFGDDMEREICGHAGPCNVAELQRYMRLCHDFEAIRHARVMFVGDSTAGKTTLMKRLLGDADYKSIDEENRTIGVIVRTAERSKVRYSLWDFAGQEAYYFYHRIFLSDRCVYVMVVNLLDMVSGPALETAKKRVQFWLASISEVARSGVLRPYVLLIGTHKDKVPTKVWKMVNENFTAMEKLVERHQLACLSEMSGFPRFQKSLWTKEWLWPQLEVAASSLEQRIPLSFVGTYLALNAMSDELVPSIQCIDSVEERTAQTTLVDAQRAPLMTWREFQAEVVRRLDMMITAAATATDDNNAFLRENGARLRALTVAMDDRDWALCGMYLSHLGCLFFQSSVLIDPNALVVTVPAWLAQVIGELIEFALVDPPKLPTTVSEARMRRHLERMRRTKRVRGAFSSDGVLSLKKFDDIWEQLGSQFNTELGDKAREKKLFVLKALQSFQVCREVCSRTSGKEAAAKVTDTATFYLFPCMLKDSAPAQLNLDTDLKQWRREFDSAGARVPNHRVVHIDFDDESVNGEHIMLALIWCQVRDMERDVSVLVRDRWKFGFTMRAQFRKEKEEREFVHVRAETRSGRWRITMICYGAWNRWWQETSLGYWVAKWIDEACADVLGVDPIRVAEETDAVVLPGVEATSTATSTSTVHTSTTASRLNSAYRINLECWHCTEAPITEVELPSMRLSSIDMNASMDGAKMCSRMGHEERVVGGYLSVTEKFNVVEKEKEARGKAFVSVLVMGQMLDLTNLDGGDTAVVDVSGDVLSTLVQLKANSAEYVNVERRFRELCGGRNVRFERIQRVENPALLQRFARRRADLLRIYGNDATRTELLVHYTEESGAIGIAEAGFGAHYAMGAHAWFSKGFYFSPSAVYGGDSDRFADYAREIREFWSNNEMRVVERRKHEWSKSKQKMVSVVEWRKCDEPEWRQISGKERLKLNCDGSKVLCGKEIAAESSGDEGFLVRKYIDALLCLVITGRRLAIRSGHARLPNRGDCVCKEKRDAHESHSVQDGRGEVVVCVSGESDEERSAQVMPRYVVRFWPREDQKVRKNV